MLDRLLGLERFSWRDPGLNLATQHPLPLWAWLLVALAAMAVAFWKYHGPGTPRAFKIVLVPLRAALLLFFAWLLAGPQLILSREKVEPDRVLLLLDRSASMQIKDCDAGPGTFRSRDDQLRETLHNHQPLFSEHGLGADHHLIWLGFDSSAYPIDPSDLPPPRGTASAIGPALDQALAQAPSAPIGGIVLFSDGRATQSPTSDLLTRLQRQAVSVFTVPLGYEGSIPDLILTQVDAPQRAFIQDPVPVMAHVRISPADAQIDPSRVEARLIDRATGQILDHKPASPLGLDQPIALSGRSPAVGPVDWTVEVIYQSNKSAPDPDAPSVPSRSELTLDNNSRHVRVEIVDRPVKVLFIEGYPRWEYRYLKTVLVREASMDSSILLISADKEFAQEGDHPITRPPQNQQEIKDYDVVILGDVPPDYFTPQQLTLIRNHVSIGGAGLLWIAGPRSVPAAYESTPLADLLPARPVAADTRTPDPAGPFTVVPTPLAQSLNVMRLAFPTTPDAAAPLTTIPDWPPDLPPLYWVQGLGPLKPVAETLAQAVSPDGTHRWPLVLRQRYGSGQSLYVTTDETWRWRYGLGDLYFERFWLQLIRLLARDRIVDQSSGVELVTPQRRVEVGQAIVLEARLHDAMLADRHDKTIRLRIEQDPPTTDTPDTPAPDAPQRVAPQVVARVELTRADTPDQQDAYRASITYRGIWRPQQPGTVRLILDDNDLTGLAQPLTLEVLDPDDERRLTTADHALLNTLAQRTGGQLVPPDQLDRLSALIPNRAKRTPNDARESLWDSPMTLIVVLTLLTVEWAIRKIVKLA